MDQIEPDALYDERADVSRVRPLLQGDVFDGVVLPGFGDQPRMVQIVAHPCAMRSGANLNPRITVAPVEPYQEITGNRWQGNPRVMPLAALADGAHYATKFVDVTACPAELLTRDRRIATLSHKGIYVLQQRLIKHYTRTEMALELLRRESAPVLTEAELQWHWIEEVLTEAEVLDDRIIDAEVDVFEAWVRDGDPSPQQRLRIEVNHTDVRRECMRAARGALDATWRRRVGGPTVEHLRYDLGSLKRGATVVVTLQNQANVQLMTNSEYANYKAGRRYSYHGGRVTRSPFRITVPSDGHWVVAIDLGGLRGRISASVAVQPPPSGYLPSV